MAKQLNVSLSFNADTSKAKAQIQDLQNTLNQLVKGSVASSAMTGNLGITKDLMEAQIAATKLQTILSQSVNTKTGNLDLTKFSESFNKAGMDLKVLKGQLDSLGPTGQKAFMSLASSIVSADVPLKRTNALVSELWTTMKNTARWQLSSSVLHGFMGTIQSATGYAKDLDESLNNIRIVTGQSAEQMAIFAERANKAAKALSTTTTEYTNASLIYYQQGLSDQEVQDRADITIKMAHASGQSAEIVSDQLTAVWNNFYDGSKSLEHYADVMTALGAATASSSDEIAGGLEKFASIADMIGLSYEYAASALATITAQTRQSEEVVGTALKTIFARIQGLNLGETLDDGTTLNKYSEALNKVGISIYDQNGELKEMDSILDEMGAKWETLNKDQQVALAQTVAGVRQYNQLVSLMDNWDFFESNLNIANNSEGALQEQADTYAESWQAARDRVKAAAEDIYDSILNPDFFITLLDGFEKLLSGIANFSDALNGLPGILTLLGSIVTKVFSEQLANSINRIAFNVKSLVGETQKVSDAMRNEAMELATNLSFESGTKSGNMEGQALKDRLVLQNQIREVSENLNEEEKEQLSTLLSINDAYAEQAILAAKRADETSDKVQDSRGDIRSTIRTASDGDEELLDFGLEELSSATARMQEINTAGLDAVEAISKINSELTATSKSADGFEKEIDQICTGLEKVGRPKAAEKVRALVAEFKATGNVDKFKKELAEVVTEEDMLSDTSARASEELSELQQDFNITGQQAQKYANDLLENEQATRSADRAAEAYGAQLAELKGHIAGFSGAMDSFGKNVVTTANGVSSLLTAFNAFKGIWETLNNSDMSGGEKVLSIMTSLAMAIPALVFGLSALNKEQLKKNMADLVEIKNGAIKIVQKGAELIATRAKTAADRSETAGIWAKVAAKIAELAASAPLLLITLAIVAAIGALVAVSWLVVKAFNAWKASTPEAKLKALEERAEKSAEAFERVEGAVNATKDAIDKLQSSYDIIDDLTVGTEAWRDAIEDVNTQVLELLDKYPQLASPEFLSKDENGMLQITEAGYDYIENEDRNRLAAANRVKIGDQIAVQEMQVDQSFGKFKHITGGAGSLSSDWAKFMQDYYNEFGDAMFTDAGAQAFMETMHGNGYGTPYDLEDFKTLIERNKDTLKSNSAKMDNINLLKDLQLETQAASVGSNRSAEEINELLGDNSYSNIKNQKLSDVKTAFGDWNDKIDYKETSSEWGMIQDFMKLQGDNVKYVAQKKGKMVLEVDGEEIEFSKDEVYNALAELYTGPEWEANFEKGLEESLKTSLGKSVENLELKDLTALDNFRSNLQDALIGTDFEDKSDSLFKDIVGQYGTSEEGIQDFQEDTEFVDTSGIDFTRLTEQLASGAITAAEFKTELQELNAQGEILSMSDFFANAAEGLGLDDEAAAEMQAYAQHMMEIAKESDILADSLASDAESAADLAVEITRMNKGIDDLADGFEDWRDVLDNSSKESAEYAAAMSKTKKALSDVLDVEEDLVSDDFVTQHLDDIAKAATGDEEAIDALRASMDEEIILRVSAGKTDEAIAKINTLNDQVQTMAAELPDIEVGAFLNDEEFVKAANALVEEAGMTADEANAYFAGIGYEPVAETTEIEGANTTQVPNASTTMTVKSIGFSEEPISIMGHEIGFLKAPQMTIETSSTPLPASDAEANMSLTSFSGDGKAPEIKNFRKKAKGSQNNYSSSNAGGKSPGSGGGSGGGGSKPKKATPTKKLDIVDRYKQVEDQLDDVTDAADDASKAMDRLYGKARIDKMKEVNKLLLNEVDLLEQKKDEAAGYLEEDRKALQDSVSEFGLSFNFDGKDNIANYQVIMDELYKQLSDMESGYGDEWDESEQEDIDNLKEKIDKVKEAISQYDETRELMEDIDNEIQDKIYEWQDNNYEILKYELELKLEINDAELKKLEYFLDKYSDNFYKMAESAALMNDKIDPTIQKLEDYKSHKEALDEAYRNGEISQEAYVEGLKEVREGYYDNLEALIELDKAMMHYYGDTLDAASEELSTFTDHMEHLTDVFDHYTNLMEILGKQKDYDAMGNFLGGKADTIRDRLDVAKEYYEMLKENSKADEYWANYQAALAEGNDDMAQWWKEQWDAEIDALDAAQAEMLGLTEEWAEAMKAVIENNMNKIAETLEKTLTGGTTFDTMMDEFDKLNTRQEEYLTKTNQIYETNKLMRTANKALDETDNKVAKQKLKNFIDETKSLQENTQLSKYELEIQQAKYDLLLAEIALEEAQNAKSTVRLSQDSEGNFGYVYTADQDAIDNAQQGVEDADNRLYNLSLEGQQEYTEKYLQAQQEMYNELTALQQAWLNGEIASEEEYQRQKDTILNHYLGEGGVLQTYSNLYRIACQTDADAVADNWQTNYGDMTQDTETWKVAVNQYLEDIKIQTDAWKDVSTQANADVEGALNDSETATKNLKDESSRLADTITSKVIPAIDEELEKVAAQTAAYAAQREQLLALIEEYENYIEALNKQVEVQSAGFDKDTDYSALMNEYLSKGGSTDDETFKELQRQREAKIAWLQTDEGGNKGPEYWGTSGQDTIDKYNRILAGGGTDEENAWFNADYVKDEELTGIFEKLGVPIEEIQAKLDALKESSDNTNAKIDESKEEISSTVKETGETTNSKVDEAKTEINDAIKSAGDTSDTVVKDTGEKTDEVIKDAGEITDGVIEETGETTVSSLQDLADVISSESGDIQGAIDSAASTVASSVGGAISSIQSEISSLRSTVTGAAIGSAAGPIGTAIGGLIGSLTAKFDSGGYTGDWGPEGKLAVLHEKELVLNQGDTANLLTSISFLKDIVSVIDSQASMASMFSMSAMAGVSSNTETLEQTVTIHAEFPNATNHSEIEEAFNNLVNRASQYANRK